MVAKLTTDSWDGMRSNHTSKDNATWAEIFDALVALDARRRTQVLVEKEDSSVISVGGGGGRYNVFIGTHDDRFLTLLNSSRPDGIDQLVVGGQQGEYPAKTIVDFDTTARAVKVFFELGLPDAGSDWQES